MSEIKFRAMTKTPEDFGGYRFVSEMVYGTGFLKDPVNTWLVSSNENEAIAFGTTKKIVKPETIGQFTGLHDKNGKEIYEGDVIKYGNDAPLNVIYQESCFCYNQKSKYISRLQIFDGINKLEVLGNIHENPELLTS